MDIPTKNFLESLHYPGVPVDFSNEMVIDNIVLLSKKDIVVDSYEKKLTLFEGLEMYAYEENYESIRDDIIANGRCERNTTGLYPHCKWVMRIDCNGVRYMSDFEKDK